MKDFTVIAEIGCTHLGSLERAKELALLAKLSGADVVKTQKRNPIESVKKELWHQPHPNKDFAYGETYLKHRQNLELDLEAHRRLKEYCESIGIEYSSSVWDITSAKEIMSLRPKFIKVPSACNQFHELLDLLLINYEGEVHISTGMLDQSSRNGLLERLADYKQKVVVYHCTSGYPVPFESLHLLDIQDLSASFPHVGFSNHGYGIAAEPVAYALGARWFERHFIDDRTIKHSDSAASLEPQGFYKMARDIKAISKALTHKPMELEPIEEVQRKKLQITSSENLPGSSVGEP